MIRIENTEVGGWSAAIRGMRNAMESWDKSDSHECDDSEYGFCIGNNDIALMKRLISAGSDERKFMRMIHVQCDIVAPMYWWKEFDTYKVGTVRNSCSTMHKIAAKEFTMDDFSHEHMVGKSFAAMRNTIDVLNLERDHFVASKDRDCWWQLIQLLPSSYNQRATVDLNYEVLRNMYHARKNHKLDEWRIGFCDWVRSLPYSELITEA